MGRLRREGLRGVMLTGDDGTNRAGGGAPLRIGEVHADVSPAGKATVVERLGRVGRRVGDGGDDINDVPRWRLPMSASRRALAPASRSRARRSPW